MMQIDVITLFPEMFEGPLSESIIKRAQEKELLQINVINLRDFAHNKHKTVDDYPYGGGAGMVIQPDPVFEAVEFCLKKRGKELGSARVILMSPQGAPFKQQKAVTLAQEDYLLFICGHYEGFDERIREHLITEEISIGDYVLTGGELPAMVIIDAVSRLIPGVIKEDSSAGDSFMEGLLEYPHYTRPQVFRDWKVPDILLSGHHAAIERWRQEQSLVRTLERRPELLEKAALTDQDREFIEKVKRNKE